MNKTKKPPATVSDLNQLKRELGIEAATIYKDRKNFWIDWNGTHEYFTSARCVERALRRAAQ